MGLSLVYLADSDHIAFSNSFTILMLDTYFLQN